MKKLILGLAALLCAPFAHAQFVQLVAEAPATINMSFRCGQTATKTDTVKGITTETTSQRTVALGNAQILSEMLRLGLLNDTNTAGWSLVAVRPTYATGGDRSAYFALYAKHTARNLRVEVPENLFYVQTSAVVPTVIERKLNSGVTYEEANWGFDFGRTSNYSEKNQGQYVHTSKGFDKSQVTYVYLGTITVGNEQVQVQQVTGSGYDTSSFATVDDPYFYYSVTGSTGSSSGTFKGRVRTAQGLTDEVRAGNLTVTVKVGKPTLVPVSAFGLE